MVWFSNRLKIVFKDEKNNNFNQSKANKFISYFDWFETQIELFLTSEEYGRRFNLVNMQLTNFRIIDYK